MKQLCFLILFLNSILYSQEFNVSKVPFNYYTGKKSDYYKELKIKHKDAIIFTAGNTSDKIEKFIVYNKNGSIEKLVLKKYTDSLITIPVSSDEAIMIKNFINDCIEKRWIYIDSEQVNTSKINADGSNKDGVIIIDGYDDYFNIYQNDKQLILSSYATHTFIENRYYGWQERQKLLNLIEKFNAIFDN